MTTLTIKFEREVNFNEVYKKIKNIYPDAEIKQNQTKTLDEEIIELLAKKNPQVIELETDENGNILITDEIKKKHPEVYDWAVNG